MRLENEINQKEFKSDYHKLVINILFTGNWMFQKQSNMIKKYGLTLQQYNILRILKGQYPEPATINLLIERMLDKMSNASRIVDRLEKKNYVSRVICKKDRRTVDVLITDKGLEILNKINKCEEKSENNFCILTNSEAKILNKLLDKLRG
jgi:DNA-binding MarR family transcriptional regulator